MADLDLTKLAKLLEMLGSDQDGEVLTAAKMVAKTVRRAKVTWKDLLQPPVGKVGPHQQEKDLRGGPDKWREMAQAAEKELREQRENEIDQKIYGSLVSAVMMRIMQVPEDDRQFIVAMNRKVRFDKDEKRRINTIYNRAFDVRRTKYR